MSIFQKLGNMKARALLVVVLVIVIIAAGLIWLGTRKFSADLLQGGVATTKTISPDLASLPGAGKPDVTYDPLIAKANEAKAKEALAGSSSAVPSLINQGDDEYGRNGFGDLGTGRCGEECYDEKGFDQDGFNREGYNAAGYDKNGFDKDGYDQNGFDKQGYDKNGFDKNGFDRFGYDKDGYDKNGCNRQGFDRQGKPCAKKLGLDCFSADGLDANGCNRDGKGPDGKLCYNKEGFNTQGYDKCGYDKDGFNKDALDRNGCNHEGKDKTGKTCYDINGFTPEGRDKFGRDKNGFDANGLDKNGLDKNGFDKDGFDKNGFDKNGCNRQGLNHAGKPCYDAKGYNDAGFDKQGYDKDGYGKDGFDKQGYDKDGYDKAGFNRNGCNRQGLDRQGQPCALGATNSLLPGVAGTAGQNADYQRLMAEQQGLQAQHNAELFAQQQAQALADQQARLAAYESMMSNQAQAILQSWTPPTQVYVRGTEPKEMEAGPSGPESVNGLLPAGQGPIIQKAGDMLFAVVETSVNSDEPGPVLARIVSEGPLQGARVMGTFERQDTKLFIRFNVLSMPNIPQSITIDAVAVDPETARTSLATAVDKHTLEKYGTLLAASFLQGMGEAVETSLGTPQLDSQGSATIASQVPATSRDQVLVGLGKVGQAMGQDLESKDIQPTVTLDSGTGVGLLVMSDLRVEQPAENENNTPLRPKAPLAPGEQPPAVQPVPVQTGNANSGSSGMFDRAPGMPGGPSTSTPLIKAGPPL